MKESHKENHHKNKFLIFKLFVASQTVQTSPSSFILLMYKHHGEPLSCCRVADTINNSQLLKITRTKARVMHQTQWGFWH